MPSLGRDRWKIAVVFLVGVFTTLIFARAYYHAAELRSRQLELVLSSGQELSDIFSSELTSVIRLIKSTAWLFYASDNVSRNEFKQFTFQALANNNLLYELQWRPQVNAAERAAFVNEVRATGLPDFDMREYDTESGKFARAPDRESYFPILYVEPASKTLLGFVNAMHAQKLTAMAKVVSPDEALASPLLSKREPEAGQEIMTIYVPVYKAGDSTEQVRGFIAGSVNLENLLQKINQKAQYLGVDFMLFDITDNAPNLIYYGKGIKRGSRAEQGAYGNLVLETDYKLPLNFAGRQWEFVIHPDSVKASSYRQPIYAILLTGFTLTLLLSFLELRLVRERRALIDAEQRLSDMTANLPVGVFQLRCNEAGDKQVTFVNQTAATFFGVTAADFLNRANASFRHILPEDRGALLDSLAQIRQTHQMWEQEFRVEIDGEVRWLHTRAVPRKEPGGHLLLNGYVEDITERRQVEQALRDMNLFQQQMIDTIPSPIFFKGPDGKFLGCNRAYEEAFATSRDYLIGKTVLDVEYLPEAERLAFNHEDMRMIEQGATMHHNIPMMLADGRLHQVLYWASGFHSFDGSPGGLVGVIVDITPQIEAQEALKLANSQQRAIFDSAPLGIVEFADGVIVSLNAKWEKMIGYSAAEMKGKSSRLWFADDESYRMMVTAAEPVLAANATYRGEWLLRRKDGGQFWCRLSGHAISLDDADASVWQYEDISDERNAAEELLQAKDAAEEATRAKSMFLANMSHEIRTPLNAIIGLAHLTLKTPLTAKQHDYVNKMHNAGMNLLGIINDILDFSKIEAGRIELEANQFSLDDVVDDLTTGIGYAAAASGLEVLFDISPDVPVSVMGDRLRLGQVLLNLVGNAIKFTEQGEVMVRVESLERMHTKIKLQFTVRDTGIGMNTTQVSKLFQPFTQADCTTTRKYGGTGLGLTISKRLVELMGGNIWVNSVAGKGSTFSFTAWFGIGENKRRPWLVPKALSGLHVLIVDDHAAARAVLAGQLDFLPLKITHAGSGEEALEIIRQSQLSQAVDLIMMDWSMPGISGLEAARLIKQDLTLEQAPHIIMVTAFGREDVRRESQNLGLDGFLVKPVNQSMLIDTLISIYASRPELAENRSQSNWHVANYDLSGLKVLLVEDNEINRQIAKELLESVGASVDIASDGREGVDKVFANPVAYDLILMDLQMPVMDGYAATALIRQNPDLAQLPIIAMTAHATSDARERCLASGMNGHIAKPIDPDVLYQSLSHWNKSPTASPQTPTAKPGAARPAADLHEKAEDDIFADIPGIDTKAALHRVAGNKQLYLRLLAQFTATAANSDGEIAVALAAGRSEDARYIAHRIKGIAGNIGAQALFKAAGELERVSQTNEDARTAISSYRGVLENTLQVLNTAIKKQHADTKIQLPDNLSWQDIDLTRVHNVLRRLLDYLHQNDASAQDYWLEQQGLLMQNIEATQYERLDKAIQSFSFAAACKLIEAMLAS